MKVREIIRLLEDDGWFLIAIRGSHRQFKHPTRPGRDSNGQAIRGPCAGHAKQYLETIRPEGAALMRYAVVIEKAGG